MRVCTVEPLISDCLYVSMRDDAFFSFFLLLFINLYELLLSASFGDRPKVFHSGNCSTVHCVCTLVVCD